LHCVFAEPSREQIAASLLSPCAFGLTTEVIFTLESAGVGATVQTASELYRKFTVNAGFGMMFFDTILYTVLALYIEQVLPSRFRASGIPLPWYFPCTPRFWRSLCGCGRPSSVPSRHALLPHPVAATSATVGPSPHDPSASIEAPDAELVAREAEGRAVAISRLRKEFNTPDGTKVAVDNVDMTFYEGQISVLLGECIA
jgi:ATP-binding cassette, subfamily A (ABC1), member 3